jgi:hypothetical protein
MNWNAGALKVGGVRRSLYERPEAPPFLPTGRDGSREYYCQAFFALSGVAASLDIARPLYGVARRAQPGSDIFTINDHSKSTAQLQAPPPPLNGLVSHW